MGPNEKNPADSDSSKKKLIGRVQALTARVTYLESSLDETDHRIGKLSSKLDRQAPAGDTLGPLERGLATARAELSGMALRLEAMETEQERASADEEGDSRTAPSGEGEGKGEGERLEQLDRQLQELESAQSMAADTLDAIQEESGLQGERLSGLVSTVAALRESERQGEQKHQDNSENIERVGEQLEKGLTTAEEQLKELKTAQTAAVTTLDSMREENEERVAGLESGIEGLKESDRQREQQLQEASAGIERANDREEQLEEAVGTAGRQLQELKTAQKTTADTLESLEEESSVRKEELTGVQSGLQTLTWGGVAALVALTAGGLMYIYKQQTQRESMENELGLVEQRLDGVTQSQEVQERTELSPVAVQDFEEVRQLSGEISNLNTALSTLSGRIGDLQQTESTEPDAGPNTVLAERMAAYEQAQAGIIENLADLGGRLTRIEELISSSGEPSSAVSEPLIPPPDPWQSARQQGRFTLQLLGVQERSSLLNFARRYRLLADSAALETEHKGAPWYVLIHGIYENRSQAAKAARQIAPSLQGTKPWVRRIPRNGAIEALDK